MVEDKTGEIHDFRENANDRILVVIQQRRKHKERFVMMGRLLRAIGMDKDLQGRPMPSDLWVALTSELRSDHTGGLIEGA
jgi:hypothetical protein